jgi:electron transport complex protein RnfC
MPQIVVKNRRLILKAVKGKYYFGGVHPHDRKALANGSAIEVLPLPESVAISCSQSLGKPATPIVEVGQKVLEGELIAKAEGPISSDVFASCCGTVMEIKDMAGANGATEKFIVIKVEDKGEKKYLAPLVSPTQDDIKARIREAGIVGLGGAGFPTAVKVAPKTPVDTLIVNGAECEPYLTCDHRLMIEKTQEIARGAKYIATALGVEKIIIGIEANKPDAIAAFEGVEGIQPVILRKQYPMGGEKQLIYVTTGRKVGLGKLPADSGVVVQNVATCYAVCEAVELGKPLYERVVTVSGEAVKNPKNLLVRLGTPISHIIDFCGG